MLGEPKNTADHTQSRKMKKQKSCLCLQDVLNSLKDASYLTSAPSPSFIPQKHHSSVCLVHRHPPKLNALYLMLWKGRLQLTYSCTFLLYSLCFVESGGKTLLLEILNSFHGSKTKLQLYSKALIVGFVWFWFFGLLEFFILF